MKPCFEHVWEGGRYCTLIRYALRPVLRGWYMEYRDTWPLQSRECATNRCGRPGGGAGKPCAQYIPRDWDGWKMWAGRDNGGICDLRGRNLGTAQCEARVLPQPRLMFAVDPATRGTTVVFTVDGKLHSIVVQPTETSAEIGKSIHQLLERKTQGPSNVYDLQAAIYARDTIESRLRAQRAVNAWRKTPTGRLMVDIETRVRKDLHPQALEGTWYAEFRERVEAHAKKAAEKMLDKVVVDSYTAGNNFHEQSMHAAYSMAAHKAAVERTARAMGAKVTHFMDEMVIEHDFSEVEKRVLKKIMVAPLPWELKTMQTFAPYFGPKLSYQGVQTGRWTSTTPAITKVDWAAREKAREAYRPAEALKPGAAVNLNPQPMWVDHKTRSYEPPNHGPATPFLVYIDGKPVTMGYTPPIRPILPSGKYDVVAQKTQLDKKTGTLHVEATVRCQDSLDQVTLTISDKVDDRVEVKVECI